MKGYFRGIFGFSDDNWVIAPSVSALQDMLLTIEEYCQSHNLRLSTDPDPNLSKTKCIAFQRKPQVLPSVYLCGNPLPWVDRIKHLGTTISSGKIKSEQDIMQKRARFIEKCNNISQEFPYAHPVTKVKLNTIYNSHFYGSSLWDFSCESFQKFESSYNRSVKIMYNLPYETHRNLIEPLSNLGFKKHVMKKYLGFTSRLETSSKPVLRQLLDTVKSDVRTTTGHNLRSMMLLSGLSNINELKTSLIDSSDYNTLGENDEWRIGVISDIVDIRNGDGDLGQEEWSSEELDRILRYACTS